MHTLATRPSPRPSLADDGFAPPIPLQPMQLGNREQSDSLLSLLPPPEPETEPAETWLDDPSYDAAAFLSGL